MTYPTLTQATHKKQRDHLVTMVAFWAVPLTILAMLLVAIATG